MIYLIYCGRHFSQILVDTGHSELNLVADTLLWALAQVHPWNACQEQYQ